MNFANRINQLPAASIGMVKAVLAIILILNTVGIGIAWFGTAVGIFVGLLAVAVCGTLAPLVSARDLLEESRQLELTAIQSEKILETHKRRGSERKDLTEKRLISD